MEELDCLTCAAPLFVDYTDEIVTCPDCGEVFDVVWPDSDWDFEEDDYEANGVPLLEYH